MIVRYLLTEKPKDRVGWDKDELSPSKQSIQVSYHLILSAFSTMYTLQLKHNNFVLNVTEKAAT
jgi:hypothetical protein